MASDRLAVVTGTSSGIGRSVAECLLERNWRVLGISRRDVHLHDHNYSHVQLDLADPDSVEQYFSDDFAREFPAHDYRCVGLVNNAALLEPVAPLPKVPLVDLARAFTINTVVPIWLMGFFLRHCGSTTLRVVNVSSGAAVNSRAGWGAYCATKAALLMAGRVFRDELEQAPATKRRDVALLSFEPGIVNTQMQTYIRGTSAEDFPSVQRFVALYEQGKLLDPALPARQIADFLASEHVPTFSEARTAG